MEPAELRAALEAILFVSNEPVKVDDLAEAFVDEGRDAITEQLEQIRRNLDENIGGFILEQTAGGWRLATRAEHDSVLKKYFAKKGENRLSIAALETLAIVAYRQPITAPEVSDIRSVNATGVIRTLLERRMIRVAGRKNVVGSPFLYRTTRDFLIHFGLNDIRDLPRLEEFGDLIGENINDDLVAAINAAPQNDETIVVEATEPGQSGDLLEDAARLELEAAEAREQKAADLAQERRELAAESGDDETGGAFDDADVDDDDVDHQDSAHENANDDTSDRESSADDDADAQNSEVESSRNEKQSQ